MKLKAVLVIVAVLGLAGLAQGSTILPASAYRASLFDDSSVYRDTTGDGNFDYVVPNPNDDLVNGPPQVGDENRSVITVDGINYGKHGSDAVGIPYIDPATGSPPYTNGTLAAMLYDMTINNSSSIPGSLPTAVNPWLLYYDAGARYTSGGGTDGRWTDMYTPTGSPAADTGGTNYAGISSFGGLLVVFDDADIDTDFTAGGSGPYAWVEGTGPSADDGSLNASDHFPTISDVKPWLVAVLAELPLPWRVALGAPAGSVMYEKLDPTGNMGIAFANIIGGTSLAKNVWGTNTFGPGLDLRLEFEPKLKNTAFDGGWSVGSTDPAQFEILPEPASMTLLGLGLLGLSGIGAARRRKK